MVQLAQALPTAETTRDAFNGWLRRGLLSTTYQLAPKGLARDLSRENVLEMTFMASLLRCGVAERSAADLARRFLDDECAGRALPSVAINPERGVVRRIANGESIDDLWFFMATPAHGWAEKPGQPPDFQSLNKRRKPATEMRLVNLPELVRRVDELFAKAEA